jgi:hypothetical protein
MGIAAGAGCVFIGLLQLSKMFLGESDLPILDFTWFLICVVVLISHIYCLSVAVKLLFYFFYSLHQTIPLHQTENSSSGKASIQVWL